MEPGGPLDMQQLFAAAAQMQSQIVSAQQRLAETQVEGSAGGGLVKVTLNGQGELVDVSISAGAIDSSDPEETAQTVADLILAACRDAYDELGDLQAEMMGPLAGGLGGLGDLGGGGGLPGIPGLPGLPSTTGGQAGRGDPGPGDTGQGDR
jgi:DNA-binding YbaB/EbfC family protein